MNEFSHQAHFRLSVVSQVVARMQRGQVRAQAVEAVASQSHYQLDGPQRRVSTRSVYRWLKAYERDGANGLRQASRTNKREAVLPQALVEFLTQQRKEDPFASIPEMLRRARTEGILGQKEAVCRTTVYRFFLRSGISVARRKSASVRDARRFAYPHRMQMMLADGKHFRAGAKRAKRLAMFFLDDATRAGLHVVVGTSENAELFQRGVYEVICRFGKMSIVFLDNGSGFIALDTLALFRNLEIPLINGEAGYPEGHGKIERFNRTAKADVLRNLDGRPDVDPDCHSLELRLQHWLREQYGHRAHEALQGKTPWQRFDADSRALRFPDSRQDLQSHFNVWLERRVTSDNIVSIDNVKYELPRGYAGLRVKVQRNLLDRSLGFLHEDKLIELHEVNLAANARARRSKSSGQQPQEQAPLPPSAADRSFARDFDSIVDAEGGFEDHEGHEGHDEDQGRGV